ncbi:MAG TPA: metallophosphoesterase [Isosphaeraceae bacterium]|nr:metallophosphoesterase [Isosphaeraceae bacterium]
MLDPQKVLTVVRKAATLFRATPGRTGSVIRLDSAKDVLVVGDLHGHVHVCAQVIKLAALDRHPGRHLVLQELVHDSRIDPDEGQVDRSHRLVDLVCALKCQYPDRVHVILGNHELSELTGRSISKKGFALNALFRQGVQESYGEQTDAILEAYADLFRSWPLACRTPNRVYLCHTVPDGDRLPKLDLTILKTGRWPAESMQRGGTVYDLSWGRDTRPETAEAFARIMDADWFVTGHHPCMEGFRQANARHLIVDGTDPYPSACLFSAQEPMSFDRLCRSVVRVPMGLEG